MPKVIGYNYGGAGNVDHTSAAPITLQHSPHLPPSLAQENWEMIYPLSNPTNDPLREVQHLSQQLAQMTEQTAPFIVFGGDHTAAMGTWSGTQQRLSKPMGLIWIDAHLDAHTFETSQSGNLHGMPLAALLGHGDEILMPWRENKTPALLPHHVHVLGFRSHEAGEKALLEKLGVNLYSMDYLQQVCLKTLFTTILQSFEKHRMPFGISLDIDAIDPQDAPGVTVPEPNGIRGHDLLACFESLSHYPNLVGLEVVEFAPTLDQDQKTEKLIMALLEKAYQL